MYLGKKDIYQYVSYKMEELGVRPDWYPVNVRELIRFSGVDLQFFPFKSPHLGAVLYKDSTSGIIVNSARSVCDQNFDMAHELIHYWLHPASASFCFDNLEERDIFKEWQANAGAAEILLPYKDFIPRFTKLAYFIEENFEPVDLIFDKLSAFYNVNPIVIDYRIQDLDNEILQYHNGAELSGIALSNTHIILDRNKKVCIQKKLLDELKRRNVKY